MFSLFPLCRLYRCLWAAHCCLIAAIRCLCIRRLRHVVCLSLIFSHLFDFGLPKIALNKHKYECYIAFQLSAELFSLCTWLSKALFVRRLHLAKRSVGWVKSVNACATRCTQRIWKMVNSRLIGYSENRYELSINHWCEQQVVLKL